MLSDTKIRAAKATGRPYKLTDGEGLYLLRVRVRREVLAL